MQRQTHSDRPSPVVVATATALPPNRYRQADLARLATCFFPALAAKPGLLERLFSRVGVEERCLALPAEAYQDLTGFESRNAAWIKVATELGERVVIDLLAERDVDAGDIGQLMTTTVTGLAVPSLDARLMNRLPFSPDLKRVPSFGLGCLGGAAGVARIADYLRAYPEELALLLSVELCSLTIQPGDESLANMISMGLFGDGAAGVLMAGAEHPLAVERRNDDAGAPAIVDSRSVFFPKTERVMGWDFVNSGFKIVLSPEVPELARTALPKAVDAFLSEHGLSRRDIVTWVAHPGGPKVILAIEEGLELAPEALGASRKGLAEVGNLSSASVLFLLDDFRRRCAPPRGSSGLLIAMGPGFCAELVLLRW